MAKIRFVAKAVPGVGWRIWNRQLRRWWGNFFSEYPQKVLDELNGDRRPEILESLSKESFVKRRKGK